MPASAPAQPTARATTVGVETTPRSDHVRAALADAGAHGVGEDVPAEAGVLPDDDGAGVAADRAADSKGEFGGHGSANRTSDSTRSEHTVGDGDRTFWYISPTVTNGRSGGTYWKAANREVGVTNRGTVSPLAGSGER